MRMAPHRISQKARYGWQARLGGAASALTLAGGLLLAGTAPAQAISGSSRIDVGFTILQNGYWKGSGSFDNSGGAYATVCVSLWYTYEFNGQAQLSSSCRYNLPTGPGYAFSAPDVQCYWFPYGLNVYTKVQAYNGAGLQVAEKDSNQIGMHC